MNKDLISKYWAHAAGGAKMFLAFASGVKDGRETYRILLDSANDGLNTVVVRVFIDMKEAVSFCEAAANTSKVEVSLVQLDLDSLFRTIREKVEPLTRDLERVKVDWSSWTREGPVSIDTIWCKPAKTLN